jgi:purine nucleosidase/pyrimidine-specific ribonucleoside hydrolase
VFCVASVVQSAEPIKVVIDTDIGEDIDDILCTAFALNSPEFEVLAITTVDGNVAARSRVARKVAQLYGVPQLQVARGYVRNIPLPDTTYAGLSGGVRYGELAPDESGLPPESLLGADELIARLAEKYPGEVTVITIGSMANIGQLLTRFPRSAEKLKQIVSNGGNFSGEEHRIGWNLRYDPIAAITAARSRVPWVLLSESTSRYCSPRAEDVQRLRDSDLPTAKLLVEAIDLWHKNKKDATPLPHVSDLNTFAYLLGGWVETVPGNVFIEIGPRGSLPGFRAEDDPKGKIMLGREIPRDKGARLREIFIQRLLSEPIHR